MFTIYDHDDYRSILKQELAKRTKHNTSYSQGAFARDIQVTPGRLSEILNEKQGISVRVAEQIAVRLGYTPSEKQFFVDLVASIHERSRVAREAAQQRLRKCREQREVTSLAKEVGQVMSFWHYLCVLELIKADDFKLNAKWIAQSLGISELDAGAAINRLFQLELLGDQGRNSCLTARHTLPGSELNEYSNYNFCSQLLSKGTLSMGIETIGWREVESWMANVPASKINYFRQKVSALVEDIFSELTHQRDGIGSNS